MIKELPYSNKNNLAFEIIGKVTPADEAAWIAQLDKITTEYEKFNVMVVLGQNASWGVEAGLSDIRWIIKHMNKFNKIAIVGESDVWKWLIKVDSFFAKFVGINEQYFDISECETAWQWVSKEA